jgi:hypothetical protein
MHGVRSKHWRPTHDGRPVHIHCDSEDVLDDTHAGIFPRNTVQTLARGCCAGPKILCSRHEGVSWRPSRHPYAAAATAAAAPHCCWGPVAAAAPAAAASCSRSHLGLYDTSSSSIFAARTRSSSVRPPTLCVLTTTCAVHGACEPQSYTQIRNVFVAVMHAEGLPSQEGTSRAAGAAVGALSHFLNAQPFQLACRQLIRPI